VEHWKQLTDDDEEAVIPYSQSVRFPSREEWAEISKRITESVIKTEGGTGGEEDPDILAIERKLDTMKIDLAFEETKLQEILDFIRDFSGLNIHIDGAVLANIDPSKTLNFKLKDATLRNVLKLLLNQVGLDYRITEEKVVLITDPKSAGGGNVLELHDIRDILVKLQDFAGPKVELVSPSAQGGGALTGATFTLDDRAPGVLRGRRADRRPHQGEHRPQHLGRGPDDREDPQPAASRQRAPQGAPGAPGVPRQAPQLHGDHGVGDLPVRGRL